MRNLLSLPVLEFVFGYTAVLAVPGPNMLAVGGLAALRGFRAAVPISLGVAAGATSLALFVDTATATVSTQHWKNLVQVFGAILLLYVAYRVVKLTPAPSTRQRHLHTPIAEFGAGFCTALTNPITAAFFAAEFGGRLVGAISSAMTALFTVPAIALLVSLSVSGLLARPMVRRTVCVWHFPMRLGTASALASLAAIMLLRYG
jgi:threonine efflux protein